MRVSAQRRHIGLSGSFRVAFGTISGMDVVAVELERDGVRGRGECCPMAIYDQTAEGTLAEIAAIAPRIESGEIDRSMLQAAMPAGAARNALDCALWDYEAKLSGRSIWELVGLVRPERLAADVSIGIWTPEETARVAETHRSAGMIKLKLGGEQDLACARAVRATLPDTPMFVDVNGGWTLEQLNATAPSLAELGVFMIEQPLGQGEDLKLDGYNHAVPLCADESCHDRSDLDRLMGRYSHVNIKLDKTGGLTEALVLAREAQDRGLGLMVGCMMGSGLAMAPAYVVASLCEVVDLDVPLIVKDPADAAVRHDGRYLHSFEPGLWG